MSDYCRSARTLTGYVDLPPSSVYLRMTNAHTTHHGQTEIALEEAGAQYTKYQIDLQNKPEWYAPKVNLASKVPAIAYGGPPVSPDQPSPESVKLAESLVLVEFIADLFPHAKLLPDDPVKRAQARFFIDVVSTKLTPAWGAFVHRGEPGDNLIKGVEAVQSLLAPTGFAVGEFSIADVALAPFLARIDIILKNELGAFPEGEGNRVLETLHSPAFARFQRYFEDLKARPSFQSTFDEVSLFHNKCEPDN